MPQLHVNRYKKNKSISYYTIRQLSINNNGYGKYFDLCNYFYDAHVYTQLIVYGS